MFLAGGWRVSGPLDPGVRGIPEGYHRLLAPRLIEPWTGELVGRARLPEEGGARVLDLACGSGVVARALPAGTRVVGADAWDEMLVLAREASGRGPAWAVADFHRLPFRGGAFDAVLCQQALQFADEPALVLGEARRVLAPGGRAVFAVWADLDASPGFAILRREVARHWGEEAAPGVAMPFSLDEPGALRAGLARAGFEDVRVERLAKDLRFRDARDFLRSYVAGSYLLELLPAQPAPRQRALLESVGAALAPWTGPNGLAFPIAAHLVSGRAP